MKQLINSLFSLILCSVLAVSLKAQQPNCLPPVALPAPTEANIFTPEQEVFLGEAGAEHILKDYHIIEDAELTNYLTRIGERLTQQLPLAKIRLQFFLVDLPDVNAFVLPGGRIYVSRKLIALAQSEDEVAGVIAHELGHLVARESAIDITRRFREVLGVTQVTDRRDIFEKYNQLLENFRRKPAAFKPRDREKGQMVADQAGFYALVSAGYDPSALARFWDRMTETKGKTGGFFSDLFGSTRPEERRLREMLKALSALPAACVKTRTAAQSEEFKQWQSSVISYTGLGRREALHGVLSKQQLSPPLRSDIAHLRFSPDGKYVLAQDDSGINVLTREPFAPLFRIEAPDANFASFTPDSQSIIFYTDNLRVERWSIGERKMLNVKEVVIRKGCLQTSLSPDGKYLACLAPDFSLNMYDVSSGQSVLQRKGFFEPNVYQLIALIEKLANRRSEDGDAGLKWINMNFSPDGRYFAAGYLGRSRGSQNGEAFDTTTFSKISLPDLLKKLIAGGFTFIGNDRLVGVNGSDYKKSALVEFPGGKVISEFAVTGELDAPTRGNYLLIRPVRNYPLGVMDLKNQVIFKSNKRPALDIYDDVLVAEMRNGEIGLYKVEKSELLATALLSNFSLGRVHVAEMSPDMKWLALSGRSRGGVWNLGKNESVLYLRGFRGGYLSEDGFFYGDFPKYETAERNVAKFNLTNGEVVPGQKIESDSTIQAGPFLVVTRTPKEKAKEGAAPEYGKDAILEILDVRNMSSLWSKAYPKETPRVWVAPQPETVALVWNVTDSAATTAIKEDARLSQRLAAMKEKEGDYFVQVLDARSGKELGKLLIETGKGSFRLSNVFAAGDWVVVTDTQNRVLVYSLKTGELKGRVFGGYATVAPSANLLCVENESGKLALYDLNTMEKRDEFIFSSPVSLVRFSRDGRQLFVLTSTQMAYLLDTAVLANAASAVR
ncbi:MAG TPA: M48 family metalloprotease [Pyrinomonadaceae bacterium]|jgi:WD40 repeat protein